MTTITKRMEVKESRKINLELTVPQDVPEGQIDVQVTIRPVAKLEDERFQLMDFAGCLAGNPVFAGDVVEIQREMRDEWE